MKKLLRVGSGLLFCLVIVLFSSPFVVSSAPEYVPDELLVRYRANVARTMAARTQEAEVRTGAATLDALNVSLGVKTIEPLFRAAQGQSLSRALSSIYKIKLAPTQDVVQAAKLYAQDPNVQFAEPNYLAHAIVTPNDTDYAQQWALTKISAPSAWDTATGIATVTLAMIDSGIDRTHGDLASKIWLNPGEVASNSIDDDANGYVDDVNGWNFIAGSNNPTDDNGHGTLVAGIAGAATNNGVGIAGVCWQCKLMPVKVMNAGGVANYSDIAAGVLYAAQKGAKVINISLGGSADSVTLHTAIQSAANDYNAVVVAGAGNDNLDANFYPAAYAEVLAVTGTDESDVRVSTTNYGTWVDVSAPGTNIRTTASGGGYATSSGTSLASPFAAGLAGLVRSQNPSWSQALVRAQIINTADNIDAANPSYVGQLGSGGINASNAVTTSPATLLRFVSYSASSEENGAVKTGVAVPFLVTLRNDWKDAAAVTATLATTDGAVTISDASANYGSIGAGVSKTNTGDTFQISVTAGLYGHIIPFTLNVNADGNNSQIHFNATTENAVVNVGGTLTSDTMWTSDHVYLAIGNVIVNTGVVLTIQPGTVVKFNAGKALLVNGTLIADGEAASPILFTSAVVSPQSGDWGASVSCATGGIIFSSSSQPAQYDLDGNYLSGSIIRHAIVEYGEGIGSGGGGPFIDHNLIWKNTQGITHIGCGSNEPVISHNQIRANTDWGVGILTGGATVRENLITDNTAGIYISGGRGMISFNTIAHNRGMSCGQSVTAAVCLYSSPQFIIINHNNLVGNPSTHDVAMNCCGGTVDVTNNYWGTTSETAIRDRIYDSEDNLSLGTVNFTPFLNAPEFDTPSFLEQITLNPPSPIGIQQTTFDLTFTATMNQTVNPVITFGATEPYAAFAVVDNGQWLNDKTWRATYEITSIVPPGTYTLSVGNAVGLDGMEIPTDTRFSFVVDYAGGITDQSPPTTPVITDDGVVTASTTELHTIWTSSDAQSAITQYQYAIGTAAGATDIVNWTTPNPATATQVTHTGLILATGQKYYFAVKAHNTGGLWSEVGVSDGILADPNFVPLAQSKLMTPKNKSSLTKTKAKLDWEDVAGATSYHIVVKQDKKNGNTFNDSTVATSQLQIKKLKHGKKYFWQVQACNEYGCYAWSKWWSFKVN